MKKEEEKRRMPNNEDHEVITVDSKLKAEETYRREKYCDFLYS